MVVVVKVLILRRSSSSHEHWLMFYLDPEILSSPCRMTLIMMISVFGLGELDPGLSLDGGSKLE